MELRECVSPVLRLICHNIPAFLFVHIPIIYKLVKVRPLLYQKIFIAAYSFICYSLNKIYETGKLVDYTLTIPAKGGRNHAIERKKNRERSEVYINYTRNNRRPEHEKDNICVFTCSLSVPLPWVSDYALQIQSKPGGGSSGSS